MNKLSDKLVKRFCEYVQIPSESKHERSFCDKVYGDLKCFGLNAQKFDLPSDYGIDGYNIYTHIPGNMPGSPVLLCAHLDTVEPGLGIKPKIVNGEIFSDGDTILGADDKTGVTAIMCVLQNVLEQNIPHRGFEILFTVSEEISLNGARAFDKSIIKSDVAYVFDSSNPVGGMISEAPSSMHISIDVYGKAAHASRAPEKGVSAIQVAAKAVSSIPLLKVDSQTTSNIGTFKSEYSDGTVPDHAYIHMSAQSLDDSALEKYCESVQSIFSDVCRDAGAKLNFNMHKSYFAYKKTDEDKSIQLAKSAMEKLFIKPFFVSACGGSDAHILNASGIDAVNLACGNKNVHSNNESISIQSLVDVYKLILGLIS